MKALKTAGQPVSSIVTITEANDGNNMIGTANGYVSKAYWRDGRINQKHVNTTDVEDVERGGAVEFMPTPGLAKSRAKYIATLSSGAGPLAGVGERDYVVAGAVILRLSGRLTAAQSKTLADAAAAPYGAPAVPVTAA